MAAEALAAGLPFDERTIRRGNTQKHVNRDVLRLLAREQGLRATSPAILDAPCGEGELLHYLQVLFPGASLYGCDIRPKAPAIAGLHYQTIDLNRSFPAVGQPLDLITSVSGVMCFGNTQQFVEQCARQLKPGGLFVVTNDNILTIRDRLSYLFTGRVRRFKLLFEPQEGNFQLVQHQELKRLFDANGLRLRQVTYTSFYYEDLLFLPFVLLVLPFQWLYRRSVRNSTPLPLREQLFGWRSLLYRHYIMVGEKS